MHHATSQKNDRCKCRVCTRDHSHVTVCLTELLLKTHKTNTFSKSFAYHFVSKSGMQPGDNVTGLSKLIIGFLL